MIFMVYHTSSTAVMECHTVGFAKFELVFWNMYVISDVLGHSAKNRELAVVPFLGIGKLKLNKIYCLVIVLLWNRQS